MAIRKAVFGYRGYVFTIWRYTQSPVVENCMRVHTFLLALHILLMNSPREMNRSQGFTTEGELGTFCNHDFRYVNTPSTAYFLFVLSIAYSNSMNDFFRNSKVNNNMLSGFERFFFVSH